MTLKVRGSRMHTNTLLSQQVDKKRAGLVVPVGEAGLVVLVLLDVVHVLVEEVRGVERTSLGFGMELGAEDGTGVVDQTLVGLVVEVGEVLPPVAGQGRGVDGVSVVLRGDVALASGEVESRDVVSAVSVLQLDRLSTSGQSNQLVTHANTHDGDLRGLEQLAEVVDGRRAMSWVARAVGVEDTVEVVRDLVDGVVEGEAGDAGTAGDEAAKDVLLDTAVDQSHMHVTERRADVERSLRRNTTHEVNSLRVDVCLVLVGIVLLADGDAGQRRTLLTEVCYNLTSVDAGDGWDALSGAPCRQRLNGSPVAVLHSVVLDDDSRSLDMRRLKVSEQAMLIAGAGGDSVVADQRLGEDENLSTVGGVGHGLGVPNEGCGEDGLAGDICFGTKRFAFKDGAVLQAVSHSSSSVW
jgi:hypothetical protein